MERHFNRRFHKIFSKKSQINELLQAGHLDTTKHCRHLCSIKIGTKKKLQLEASELDDFSSSKNMKRNFTKTSMLLITTGQSNRLETLVRRNPMHV